MKHSSHRASPVLIIALAGLWLLLNQSHSPAQLLLGVVMAWVFAKAVTRLRPLQARIARVDTAALLILVVLKDIIHSNFNVARIVLGNSRFKQLRPGFLRIPLVLRDPHGLAALAAIVTATPGTVWAGLSPEGDSLTLHVLDLTDEAAVIRSIKQRYEQPLIRIFQ
jgi:multicomponent K+:H+ antiporter subunit E